MSDWRDDEIEEYAALTDKLSQLLRGTADGLKGDPGELRMHDWSDLPETAKEARALLLRALEESDGHTSFRWDLQEWFKKHTWGHEPDTGV